MLNGEVCFPGDEILLPGFEGHKIVFFFFLADAEEYTNILFLSCLHSEIPHVYVHGVGKYSIPELSVSSGPLLSQCPHSTP